MGKDIKDVFNSSAISLSAQDLQILFTLRHEEMYGLQIIEHVNEASPAKLNLGAFYNRMNKLETRGLLTQQQIKTVKRGNAGKRKYYAITDLGRDISLCYYNTFNALYNKPLSNTSPEDPTTCSPQ